MAKLQQLRVIWTGVGGMPGYSNHYFVGDEGGQPPLALVSTFYNAIKGSFPTTLSLQIQNTGNVIDDGTGELVGGWAGAAQSVITGTGPTNYNSAQGAIVEWKTSTVIDKHRPIGKTFLVPFITGNIGAGILSSTSQTTLQNAASALVSGASPLFAIWHRPVKQKVPPHAVTRVGGTVLITSATVPSKMCVLTSRRD